MYLDDIDIRNISEKLLESLYQYLLLPFRACCIRIESLSLPLVSGVAPVKYDESTGSRSPQRCPGPDAAQLRLEYSHTCICGPTCVQRWVPHVQYVVSKSKKTLQCPSWNATAMLAGIGSVTTASRRAQECRDCRVTRDSVTRRHPVAAAAPP
jgi:hypothetical protein